MARKLERWYGLGHLHFITTSCYRRLPLLKSPQARDIFLKQLSHVRDGFDFALLGYVVMPEHVHLLMSEPNIGDPSNVMQVLKERTARALSESRLWQERFYDFNVYSPRKKNEKMSYMHFNPVKRGLAHKPDDWIWSSCRFYTKGERGLCPPNPEWVYKENSVDIGRPHSQPLFIRLRGV